MRFQKEIHFSILPSTNTYLKENYSFLENYTVVTAKHQLTGRGRMNRVWFDGEDLLLSVLIKDKLNLEDLSKISLVTAAAIYKSLSKYIPVKIKWPNDLVVADRKIAGILVETIIQNNSLDALIIGIGINVNTKEYPKEIENKATSIYLETSKKVNLKSLKEEVLRDLDYYYGSFLDSSIEYLDVCRRNSSLINREVWIDDFHSKRFGIVQDILESGNILILVNGEKEEFHSGEITLHANY